MTGLYKICFSHFLVHILSENNASQTSGDGNSNPTSVSPHYLLRTLSQLTAQVELYLSGAACRFLAGAEIQEDIWCSILHQSGLWGNKRDIEWKHSLDLGSMWASLCTMSLLTTVLFLGILSEVFGTLLSCFYTQRLLVFWLTWNLLKLKHSEISN